MNSDKIINDLSNYQVSQNILSGKYNAPAATNREEISKRDILMKAGIEN